MNVLGRIIEMLLAPVTGRRETPQEVIDQRHGEIGSWLQERVSVDQALERMRADTSLTNNTSTTKMAVDGLQGWIDTSLDSGDELWYYDTGGDSWYYLRGENGFAIVRAGKVVDFYMWWMN